jgi:hypothetical protein
VIVFVFWFNCRLRPGGLPNMRAFLPLFILPVLGGCADLASVLPTASAKFTADRQTERTQTAQLVSDLSNEDATLNFLSADTYSCGDPRKVKDFLIAARVKQKVKDENVSLSKDVQKALKVLDTYAGALDSIQKQDATAKQWLATLDKLVGVAAKIPSVLNVSAAADAALPIGNSVVDAVAIARLQELAWRMQKPLQDNVSVLKRNLTELTGDELNAFRAWDECARETLVYLREVPLNQIKTYQSFVAQSTGVELQAAYQNYLTKRAQSQSPDLKADLDAILAQNKKLMNGVQPNADALITALGNGFTFASKLPQTTQTKKAGT